ncbi:MAG: hypothetical protein H7144_15130 [Burkholderiales bacterium]|nr:hypothetical protein [Phycisphaerae bacterium]
MKITPVRSGVVVLGLAIASAGLLAMSASQADNAASEIAMLAGDRSNRSPLATLVRGEVDSIHRRETAVAAMPCFWSGEGYFGALDCVYRTTAGYVGADEVVEVEFDPSVISYQSLITGARDAGMAVKVYCRTDAQLEAARHFVGAAAVRSDERVRPDENPKWYVLQTPLKSVPMTPAQACRISAALHAHRDVLPLLSPSQQIMYDRAKGRDAAAISEADRLAFLGKIRQR